MTLFFKTISLVTYFVPIRLEKVQGEISLDKDHKPIIIEKTPEITATVSWESGTDYDIYALIYNQSFFRVFLFPYIYGQDICI